MSGGRRPVNGIYATHQLTADDLLNVDAIAGRCREHDGIEAPLQLAAGNAPECSHFLNHVDGVLAGYASLSDEGGLEMLMVVAPESRRRGVATALLRAVAGECERRASPSFLLVCEEACASGAAYVATLGVAAEFSEHCMKLHWPDYSSADGDAPIVLYTATMDNLQDLVQISAEAFGADTATEDELAEHLLSPANQFLMAQQNDESVGMLRIANAGDAFWINGVAVRPKAQRRGVAGRMLNSAIKRLDRNKEVWLEVETSNDHALALYKSLGFRTVTTYRYYRVAV